MIPKLPPPPPRMAHSRSGFSVSLTCKILPLASTMVAARMLSEISPAVRWITVIPPPVLIPPIPTVELSPKGARTPSYCN